MQRVFHGSILLLLSALLVPAAGAGQTPQAVSPPRNAAASATQQGIYLVFPFENDGASPTLDWLGEGLEELTIERLSAAGQQVYSHDGLAGELDRFGLPETATFSHASMLRIAEDLDADFVVFGSFQSDGKSLAIQARVLRIHPLSLLKPVEESGDLTGLMELHNRLVWRLLGSNDRGYPLTLAEFSQLQRPLRLDAFEHYVRGVLAQDDDARIRELREAARLEPNWPEPQFALGESYFGRRDCGSANYWLAKIPKAHDRYVEAVFMTGVCQLTLGQPERAELTFGNLQDALHNNLISGADLPEILNNLAIARARQGKSGPAEESLRRAADIDPDEDDYPFNLGLLELRAGDAAGAAEDFEEAVDRAPDNGEDRALLIMALDKAGKKDEADQEREAATEALGPDGLPKIDLADTGLDRIENELDMTALRLEIQTPNGGTEPIGVPAVSAMTPLAHVRRGRQELSAGHLDLAEKEFRAALAGDSRSFTAHRGLAEVARRRDKLDEAVKELQASLAVRESAVTRTLLARVYLDQKKPGLAKAELGRALKLAPNYAEAKQLLGRLQTSAPEGTTP